MDAENLLDDVLPENSPLVRRRALLPWWMKVFAWIFIVTGALSIPVFIAGLMGFNAELSLYGLESYSSISFTGILTLTLFFIKGLVGYGLWAEKDWAINMGYADAIIGIFICLFIMLGLRYFHPDSGFTFRLELLLLVPYLIKLRQLHPEWDKRSSTFIKR
ncbi:MAG TPA: hypothetical protein VNS58_06455 [Puia sp.]|nr:hypothetical protein [Puia sp.]